MPEFRVPSATYRFQFNSRFRFADAQALVPYLSQLGISDIYASPVFQSRPGSVHGYDITDPTRLNPELGSQAEFESLVQEIQTHNMGLLLDIVPNHMSVSSDNPFWMDLLENGLSSRYADFFDIDWETCDGIGENRVILPILGKPYGQALESQEISLNLEDSTLFIRYADARLPISLKSYSSILTYRLTSLETRMADGRSGLVELKQILQDIERVTSATIGDKVGNSGTDPGQIKQKLRDLISSSPEIQDFLEENVRLFNGEKGNPRSFDNLEYLLNRQVYRLVFWRTGREELNFRRFFDINNLIGVRVELPRVMEISHELVFRLVKEGKVTGLRIDHIDGLYDPLAYLTNLNQSLGRFYVVVEKILSGDEILSGDWLAYGTTGYEFFREVNDVFVDSRGMLKIDTHYRKMIGESTSFADVVYAKKKQIIGDLFFGEVSSLACKLFRLAIQDRYARDLSERELTQIIIEITANLPVYRTYIRGYEVSPVDKYYLEEALNDAHKREPNLEQSGLDFLRRLCRFDFPAGFSPVQQAAWLDWIMRWQQFTGPVTAKGLEDTALYSYNRLVSLNVIGADLQPHEWSADKFHHFNIDRQSHWPVSLNNTMTHDSKRSEDVSSRINVISEIPQLWLKHLSFWRLTNYNKRLKVGSLIVPDPNTEELLYQTLIGSWPSSSVDIPAFKERFKGYMLKAVREAKVSTSWIRPYEEYEKALLAFVDAILEESSQNEFLGDFHSLLKQIDFYGSLNSLGQVLLKIASPGVPDFYQGTELWNLSLVDPDNRRPVDYQFRKGLLSQLVEQENQDQSMMVQDILKYWQDGRIKLYLTYKALNFRRKYSELFEKGNYLPLYAEGNKSNNVLAFARNRGDEWIIAAAPRLSVGLVETWTFPLGKSIWKNDVLILPEGIPGSWTNIFTGEILNLPTGESKLPLALVFNAFPVALLVSRTGQ